MAGKSEGKLRGALVGYGFIGAQGHLPAYRLRSDVELVAVADVSPARRALAAAALPGARIHESAAALLEAERELDFVDVATPPSDHAAIAGAALARGLHVLCEKPLARTPEEAAGMLQAAARARRVIFPCHNYKHAPVVAAVREILASGRIGEVRSATLATFRNTHARGVPEWNPHWRRQAGISGGGIAMDHGSHTFYLTFEWLGAYPTAVTARTSNREPGRWDTEDTLSAVLTFPGGEAHAHLTWTAGVRKVLYTVQGARGAVTVDDDELQLAVMRPTGGPDVAQGPVAWDVERRTVASDWMDASHAGWFNAMFDRFLAAVARGDHVGTEAREAYRCVELIAACYRSAADGCREQPLRGLPPGLGGAG